MGNITCEQAEMANIIQRRFSTSVHFHTAHNAVYVADGLVAKAELAALLTKFDVYFDDGKLWVVATKNATKKFDADGAEGGAK